MKHKIKKTKDGKISHFLRKKNIFVRTHPSVENMKKLIFYDIVPLQNKMTESYHIIDPQNVIKNKPYLEKWLEENKFKKESLLKEQVEYEKDVTQKYTFVTKNMNPLTRQYDIQFYETKPLSKHEQFKNI